MEQVGTVLLWWTSSVGGSIFSKKVFEAIDDFSIPLTFAQITTAAVCMSAYYTFNGYKRASDVTYRILGILTMLHMFGNLFTNVSMEHGNVAFTHTVKASEPLFTILFSQFFSNTKESQHSVYLATLPLIIGVVITTVSEVEFSLIGLFTALCSNVCFALRNVWVKQTTSNADNFQLFFHFSLGSSILLGVLQSLRSTFLYPWIQAHPQVISEDQSPVTLFWWIILASVLHFLYNIFSFAILQEVTPLTHAVINLVKRTAIIFGSMLVFSTPTSILNLAGIFITLAGGALFSAVKIKIHSNHHHPKNAGEIPIHVQDHSKSDEPLPSNRKSLFVFIGLIFTAILLFSLVTTQSNTTSNSDIIETAVHIPTNNQESTTGMPNSGNPQSNPPAPTNETNQVVPTTEECSLTDTLYEKLLNKTDSLMMRIGIESVPNSVVLVFGFTAIQGSQQHFGQFGASYVIDREMRARFGEDVMVLPFPPSTSMQKLKAATPFSDMVVMNFEGSFHDNSWGSKYIIEGLNYFINYSVPTYAINIAWYPTTEKEQGAALIKNPIVKHVAARDQKSFQSMKELGIDVHQAADLTFLLPYKFDCLVNQFFAEKNRFWAQSEKLKIVVTKDSGGGGTTQKVVSLIRKEYGDNVEIISILDYVFQGNRLVHITEDSIYEALWIIKNADLVITGRFHCATFARLVSVPTAMLSGNTPKLRQLSAFINSTAYPYIHAPDQGMTYTETIWKKAKEALEYSKTVNLEDDGLVPILRELASVNFPEGSYLYNRTQVTIDELRRELNFSQVVKGIWGVVNTTPANYYALQYNTTKGSYTSYDYPLKL